MLLVSVCLLQLCQASLGEFRSSLGCPSPILASLLYRCELEARGYKRDARAATFLISFLREYSGCFGRSRSRNVVIVSKDCNNHSEMSSQVSTVGDLIRDTLWVRGSQFETALLRLICSVA